MTNIELKTDMERINAYESENIWIGIITYEDGQKLKFKDEDRNKLIGKVKEQIK